MKLKSDIGASSLIKHFIDLLPYPLEGIFPGFFEKAVANPAANQKKEKR